MSGGWVLALLCLAPVVVWAIGWAVLPVRAALVRRRGEDGARALLRTRLSRARARGREYLCVPTALVGLHTDRVREEAAAAGWRLAGFQYGRGPWPRRVGVLVRTDGALAEVLAGAPRAVSC